MQEPWIRDWKMLQSSILIFGWLFAKLTKWVIYLNNFEVLITNDMNTNSYYQIHSLITLSPIDERGTPPEFFRAGGRRDTGLTGSQRPLDNRFGREGRNRVQGGKDERTQGGVKGFMAFRNWPCVRVGEHLNTRASKKYVVHFNSVDPSTIHISCNLLCSSVHQLVLRKRDTIKFLWTAELDF